MNPVETLKLHIFMCLMEFNTSSSNYSNAVEYLIIILLISFFYTEIFFCYSYYYFIDNMIIVYNVSVCCLCNILT